MSSTKPTSGTTGGQLHGTFPPRGRFGGESVADRAAAKARQASEKQIVEPTSSENPAVNEKK